MRLLRQSAALQATELPEWRHQAFENLFSSLSSALDERQVREVSNFHRRLDKLREAYTKMQTQPPNQPESAAELAARQELRTRVFEDALLEAAATGTVTPSPDVDVRGPIEEEVTKLIDLGDRLQRSLQPTKVRVGRWIDSLR